MLSGRVNIQIFGLKKCSQTKKAERFFKERNIPFQLINMQEKPMSRGELQSVSGTVPPGELIDTEGREYSRLNLKYMNFSIEEKLLENPILFRTPIVRNGKKATAGYDPETWKRWIEESRK